MQCIVVLSGCEWAQLASHMPLKRHGEWSCPLPSYRERVRMYVCMYVCIVECNIMRECTARCAFGRRVSPPDCHATATGGGNRASPRAANASAG